MKSKQLLGFAIAASILSLDCCTNDTLCYHSTNDTTAMTSLRTCFMLFAAALVMGAADVTAQHVFLDECDRAHAFQPRSCYVK